MSDPDEKELRTPVTISVLPSILREIDSYAKSHDLSRSRAIESRFAPSDKFKVLVLSPEELFWLAGILEHHGSAYDSEVGKRICSIRNEMARGLIRDGQPLPVKKES